MGVKKEKQGKYSIDLFKIDLGATAAAATTAAQQIARQVQGIKKAIKVPKAKSSPQPSSAPSKPNKNRK
jgi:hypothetical protein